MDRYFIHVILNAQKLSEKGRLFILNQSSDVAIFLYEKQAQTRYDLIDVFSKGGSYQFIDHIFNKYGIYKLVNVTESGKSILHNWILNGESLSKHQKLIEILEKYKIDINITDNEGRTPLYYAVDGWLYKPELSKSFWQPLIKSLLRKGADPFFESKIKSIKDGKEVFLSPYNLFTEEIPKEREFFRKFKEMIEKNHKMKTDPEFRKRELDKEMSKYF